jgi:hypothetical protein
MTRAYQAFLVVSCVVALIGFVFIKESWASSPQPAAAAEATEISSSTDASASSPRAATTSQVQNAPISTRIYTNSTFDFSLTYPSNLLVSEYDEGGGTKSIVFQKPNDHVGFQMFITPDPGDDPLTPGDIELDFPTLKMEGTQSLTIATGTAAVAFATDLPDFGPTRHLWFTHDGYLFEILTYPNLGSWLTKIIDTVRFP